MLHPYHTVLLAETDAAHSTTPCACRGVFPEKLPSYSHPVPIHCSEQEPFTCSDVQTELSTVTLPIKPQGAKRARQDSRLFNC